MSCSVIRLSRTADIDQLQPAAYCADRYGPNADASAVVSGPPSVPAMLSTMASSVRRSTPRPGPRCALTVSTSGIASRGTNASPSLSADSSFASGIQTSCTAA